jgi:L-cysteine S-thiosulfotransferase
MRLFYLVFLSLTLGGAGTAAERVVAYEIVDAREIPASLTGRPGDPQAGRALYFDDKLARCAGCHGAPDEPAPDRRPASDAAADAPPLTDVGRRLGAGALRLWLVAPQVIAPETRMPPYYAVGQRMDPADPRFGEPLLTASQIEDLVAYLMQPTR